MGRTGGGLQLWAGAAALLAIAACHGATPVPVPDIPAQPPAVVAPAGSASAEPDVRPTASRIDERVVRFEIVAVQDTTFTFVTGPAPWVRGGMRGIAVDPRRRDALVARFRVVTTLGDSARAVVTGEAARLTADHVALLRRPRERALARSEFWGGWVIGATVGAVVTYLLRR